MDFTRKRRWLAKDKFPTDNKELSLTTANYLASATMRLALMSNRSALIASFIGAVLLLAGSRAHSAQPADPPALRLQIVADGWGNAVQPDVRKVLESAGSVLVRHFPGVELPPLQISPRGGPIVLHDRLSDGTIQIHLDTGDQYWSQYAFQFGHELCHVLCRFDQDPTGNLWFEESLCEMASLFVLRRMSETWASEPPYPNWKDYAPSLATYARERMDQAKLPAGQSLAAWYREHARALAKNATDRDLNLVVATALLAKFESQPQHWAAVHYLNVGRPVAPQPFTDYLGDWHANVPAEHRPFVAEIADEFGIKIPSR
jgi:hypothetical protein